jgi:sRNA-binding protein
METTTEEGHEQTPTPSEPGEGVSRTKQREQEALELLTRLGDTFPKVFIREWGTMPVPLKAKIREDIVALWPDVPLETIKGALRLYMTRTIPLYWQALKAGAPRYGLDGSQQGEVTAEQQEQAEKELAAWQARRKRKQEAKAATEASPQSKPHNEGAITAEASPQPTAPPATAVNGGGAGELAKAPSTSPATKAGHQAEGKKPVAKSPDAGRNAGDRAGGPPLTSSAGRVDPRPVQPRPQPAPKVTPPTAKEAATILMQGRTERVAPRVVTTRIQPVSAPRMTPKSAPNVTTTVAVVRKRKMGK